MLYQASWQLAREGHDRPWMTVTPSTCGTLNFPFKLTPMNLARNDRVVGPRCLCNKHCLAGTRVQSHPFNHLDYISQNDHFICWRTPSLRHKVIKRDVFTRWHRVLTEISSLLRNMTIGTTTVLFYVTFRDYVVPNLTNGRVYLYNDQTGKELQLRALDSQTTRRTPVTGL